MRSRESGVVRAVAAALAVAALAACSRKAAPPREIRVLTDRTEAHVAPLFADFERATGVAVKPAYVDKGLLARLESRPTEADLVITKDADLLEIARKKGLLKPLSSERVRAAVPPRFREASGAYFSDAYRARAIFYARDRVKPDELSTYEALAEPKWKGRVCLRSGYHDYNLSLFGQMLFAYGPARTRAFVTGLRDNLARPPQGDDRGQVRAIFEKKCDVALANSYYMGIMLSSAEQRPWGLAAGVFFPDQKQGGAFILRSGLALTNAMVATDEATALLERLVQPDVQDRIAALTFAYPVAGKAPLSEVNQALGEGQPEVVRGAFQVHDVPLEEIAARRDEVVRLLDELQFDQPR